MTDQAGAGTPAPDALTITLGSVTVLMAPCGFRDLIEIPEALRALGMMPSDDTDALRAAMLAFADRLDAYALGPVKPSRIPAAQIAEFVGLWLSGVRDAVLPPADDEPSPLPQGSPQEARSTRSRSR